MKVTMRRLGMKTGPAALDNFGASGDLLIAEVYGKTYCYLIDGGMETKDDEKVTWRGPMELDAILGYTINDVLLTHAHRDHAGALAMKTVLNRLSPDARVILTKTSAAFLPHVLLDQVKISSKREEKLPYGQYQVFDLMKRVKKGIVSEPRVLCLVPDAISVLVWPSAHIRGACSFIFLIQEGEKKVKIMFSGDYSTHNQLSTLAAPLPPDDWYPDIIANFDCTNGAEDLAQGKSEVTFWQREMERMADDGHRIIKGGGKAFYYAFSMDRSQTFSRKLADLGLPVWLDGPSAQKLSHTMGSPEGMWCSSDQKLDMGPVCMTEYTYQPLDDPEPCGIVAPSGMGHGPAVEYFARLLPREDALVGSSGYQAHGTNGYRLKGKTRGDTVSLDVDEKDSVKVTIAAEIKQYRATAHSLRGMAAERMEELLSRSQFLHANTPILGMTHGSSRAFDWFERRLAGIKTFRADRPEDREIVLVD